MRLKGMALALVTTAVLSNFVGVEIEAKTKPISPKPIDAMTVQNIMDNYVDPSADTLWASVGTIETKGKTEFKQPNTDAEWLALRAQAQQLILGTKRLAMTKKAGAQGHGLADASTPGIRTPSEIERQIANDPAHFQKAAERLQTAGFEALHAIDARQPDALIKAGANMDAACEACHSAYWYPRTPPMKLLSPEAFGRIASRP